MEGRGSSFRSSGSELATTYKKHPMCLFVGPQSCWCLIHVSGFFPPEKWHRLDITKSPRFPLCPRSRPPGFSGANRYRKRRWNKPRCKGPMFKGNSPPVDSCWAWPRIIRIITIQSWLFLERKQSKYQQNEQPGQNKRGRFMNDLASFEQIPSYFLVTILYSNYTSSSFFGWNSRSSTSTAQVDAADAQGTEMEGKITLAALQERRWIPVFFMGYNGK